VREIRLVVFFLVLADLGVQIVNQGFLLSATVLLLLEDLLH
jgi:hypothetical protein